jgi:BirA family biotin operon repressor/biotin-[acetyl-CoA-carboxylase] ligase
MSLRASASTALSSFDLGRMSRESFIADVEFHTELDSTNDRAIALAAEQDIATPLLVLTERQTAGRGRGQNHWWSAPGSLTFSLLFDTATIGVPMDRWPQVSLAAALAIRQTIADLLPGDDVRVKWPNDVFLRSRKVAGILVEIPPVRPQKLVLGVGINVNNSFTTAPAELREKATSLIDNQNLRCHATFDLTELLLRILQQVAAELTPLKASATGLATRWRPHCFLDGRTVHIASGATTHIGLCRSIDETGALHLETESGRHRLLSGVVSWWESQSQ